jgi:prephenate dehydrogenase
MRVAMLGLGLIGGSVARAALAAGADVRAWTPGGAGPRAAEADGIRPAAGLAQAVEGADLVVLAAPPLACLELVDALARGDLPVGPDTVVTDVASTKAAIVECARAAGLRFVGGHPLAGRETSGYGASDAGLFADRPWVIVPPEPADEEAIARVETLIAACGGRPVRMTAADHDRAVAAISHLPLVVAAGLAETLAEAPDRVTALRLAAGGWASGTRVARGDVEMGTGILSLNAAAVSDRLRAFRAVLDGWQADLDAADADAIRERLAGARASLETGDAADPRGTPG